MIQSVRFVLCETSHPGNIGAAARAIKTMGFSELVLVSPKEFPSEQAVARASGATDVLAAARVVESLDDAVADMRGEPGTDLTVTVYRDGKDPFDVTLTREVIEPKYVEYTDKGDGIAQGQAYIFRLQVRRCVPDGLPYGRCVNEDGQGPEREGTRLLHATQQVDIVHGHQGRCRCAVG